MGDELLKHLLVLAALAGLPLAAQDVSFTPQTIAAGNSPVGVRLIDFSGNNMPDIVVINAGGSDTVSVLMNQGNGNFAAPVATPTGGLGGIALTSGDYNHDGKPDLAVVNNLSNNVSILLGNGDGTFRLSSYASVGSGPVAVTEADFRSNGNTDLAVLNTLSGDVTILLGKQDGSFRPGATLFVGGAPTDIKSGDFNADGIPDLAVTDGALGQHLVHIFLGNGDGTFRDGAKVPVGNEPFALVARDFNHDGKIDLAVANLASNDISVLLGNGDGTFQRAVNYAAGNGPVSIRSAAFTRDGNVDLAACADVSEEVLVYLGRGDGTFRPPASFPTGGFCNSVAVSDLNQTGRSDIVAATTDSVVVLLNNGASN
jgi:hypothetical protein